MRDKALLVYIIDDDELHLAEIDRLSQLVCGEYVFKFFRSQLSAVAAHFQRPADIVIADLRMPGKDGLQTIADMQEFKPTSIYMLLSGFADFAAAVKAINDLNIFRFLTKRLSTEGLQTSLDSARNELISRRAIIASRFSTQTLNRIDKGVALLDSNGTLLYANNHAAEMLAASELISIDYGNRFIVKPTRQARELDAYIASLSVDRLADATNRIFVIDNSDCSSRIVISAQAHFDPMVRQFFISLIISDPLRVKTNPKLVESALGLLPSEARIVSYLADLGSIELAAHSGGVSVNTARTYIKSVFQKTGVSKQAELVRLVLLTAA